MPDHKAAARDRARRKSRIAAGLCGNCGKNPITDKVTCQSCLNVIATRVAKLKQQKACIQCARPRKHGVYCKACQQKRNARVQTLKRQAEQAAKCNVCRKATPTRGLKTCRRCRKRGIKNTVTWKTNKLVAGLCAICGSGKLHDKSRCQKCINKQGDKRRQLREAVLDAYGRVCRCCGETEEAFLQIDHIRGGGRQHLKQIGTAFYAWLKRHNFPDGFQTLCCNCNFAKAQRGICPHQLNRPS